MNPTNKQIQPFDSKTQKLVFDIFYAHFSEEIEKNNCFLLATVGQKISNDMQANGFNGAKASVFCACPEYFICGYDITKQNAVALAVVGYDIPESFVPQADISQKPKINISKILKNHFQYNEVPVRIVEEYLEKLSVSYSDIYQLISENAPDMKFQEMSYGEGHPTEEFLVIHPPLEVPENIKNRIIWITKKLFANRHIAQNKQLGAAFRKLGVHFKDYKYLDLTAFIRSFSDIFSIISIKKNEKNEVDISVRILHDNLKDIPLPELDIDPPTLSELAEKKASLPITDDFFRNGIFEAYQNGAYQSLTEKIYISYGMKHTEDTELWEVFINAFLKSGAFPKLSEYTLNPWEKAVFPLDLKQMKSYLNNKEQMVQWGFSEEELPNVEALVEREHSKVTTVSALAARLAIFSPQCSPLPEILFSIGLLQSEKAIRESAVRNLSLHYLKQENHDSLLALWEQHHVNLSTKAIVKFFRACMERGASKIIVSLWNTLPQTIGSHAAVIIYFRMASYLQAPIQEAAAEGHALLKELSFYPQDEQIAYLNQLVEVILQNKQYSTLSSLFGAVLAFYSRRKADDILRQICPMLLAYEEELLQFLTDNYAPSQLALCAFWEFLASQYSEFSAWNTKRDEVIAYYREQIASANKPEDALRLTQTALTVFPEENSFRETQIRLIEEKYADMDQEEPYKKVLAELAKQKSYWAVIGLSESKKLFRYHDDIWYQELLQLAYHEQLMLSDAIALQLTLLNHPQISKNKQESYTRLLYEDLFDYFYLLQKNKLPEPVALYDLTKRLNAFSIENGFENYQQVCVLAKLFLMEQQYPKSAFLYALTVSSTTVLEDIKSAMQTNKPLLVESLSDISAEEMDSLDTIFQYVLTTLPMNDIDDCLELGQKIVPLDQFETSHSLYRADRLQWKENYSLPKLLCSSPNYGEGWRLYNDNTKDISHVNYVAAAMLVHRAGNMGFPLNNCMNALRKGTQESMPKNLLDLSYAILTQHVTDPRKKEVFSYCIPFVSYVKRYQAFQHCSEELTAKFLDFTTAHKDYTPLTIEIFKQLQNLELFFRYYLTEENTVNEQAIACLDIDFLLPLVLYYLKHSGGFTQEEFHRISLLLDYVKTNATTPRQKMATLWVEEMVDRSRAEQINSAYFQISFQLLQYYPDTDYSDFSKYSNLSSLEHHCNLLDRWLEINPHFSRAKALYYYYSRLTIGKKEQERQLHFRYISNALIKMFENSNVADSTMKGIMRTGKNMLPLYFLNNFYYDTHIQVTISELLEMLDRRLNKSDLLPLLNALLALWEARLPYDFRDGLVFCGITNYWDQFLMELTVSDFDWAILSNEAVLQYVALLETHKLNRRILQMVVLSKIAEYNENTDASDMIPVLDDEFPVYEKMAKNKELNHHYFENLTRISKLSGDRLHEIVHSFLLLPREDLRELLPLVEHFILDKRFQPMLSALLADINHPFADDLVKLFFVLQAPDYIMSTLSKMLLNQPKEQPDTMLALLKHPVFVTNAGEFFSAYLPALYHYGQDNLELAEETLPAPELCPQEYAETFLKVQNALANRIPLSQINFNRNQNVPKLSFVEAMSPASGEHYGDLLINFESGNRTNNEKTLIQMAKKIYHLMNEENDFSDYPRLVMRWGFLEIAVSQNYSHRLSLLGELADYAQLMENPAAFEADFLEAFTEIFLSYSERAIVQDFDKIETVGQQIAELYHKKEIAAVLELIHPIAEDFKKPAKEFHTTLSQLLNEGTLLRNHHATNQLIQKCYDVIFDYKTLLENKGRLDIQILNENGFFSGSVFYTIKNIGSYPVSKLRVVVSISKDGEPPKDFTNKFAGLQRGQTLAEEVVFAQVPPEETVQITVDVTYSCQEHKALNMQKECFLTSKIEEYQYSHKAGPDFLIHRMELDNIYNTICNKNIVMLYGTNGTGKTSLLKLLKKRFSDDNTPKSHTFTVLLAENEANRSATGILKTIMKSFCYCEGSIADTSSVYEQLKTFLSYSSASPETQQTILSKYREYLSCSTEDSQATFGNLINLLKNLDNKFMEFKKYFGYDFKFCLLWDAFETVISSVKPEDMNFKSLIDTFKGEESQIRIVFTGSNKLLEVAEVKNDADPWNIMFRDVNGEASIKVGNLNPKDFETIITDPNLLNNGEIHFSQAALDYLYQYTNGHIRYSKMFVDHALKILDKRSVNRRCIYPSDLKIHGSDCESSDNEQQIATNLTAQIFQDITDNFDVISVGYTLAEKVSDGNHAVPAAEVQNTAFSKYHSLTAEQFNRAIEILKARDFITEELDKYKKPNYRFKSVLYQQHFLNRKINISQDSYQEKPIEELIYEVKNRSYSDVNQLAEALNLTHKNLNVHIERQYNDHATDQSIGTQTNIQINAQTIATTFNAMLTADPEDVKKLFASLPMASSFIAESKKEELQGLCEKLEVQEKCPVNPFSEDAKERQNEQAALEEQISEIVEPAITEMHNTYKSAVIMAEDTIDQFEPWKIMGLNSKAEYEVMTCMLKEEFVADLYFATKLDYLFQIMKDEESVDFSPVTIMYCKLIEKMLKFYHTDIYADKLPDSSTQNSLKDRETNKDRLILFGHLKNDTTLTPADIKYVRNKIMIGAFLYPINPYFGNMQSRKLLSNEDSRLEAKWKFHGKALSEISRTRNDSAHGSSNRRITADRLDTLKCWLFADKELQTIVELSVAHSKDKE